MCVLLEILDRIRIEMSSNFRYRKSREEMLGYMSGGLEIMINKILYNIWTTLKSSIRLR